MHFNLREKDFAKLKTHMENRGYKTYTEAIVHAIAFQDFIDDQKAKGELLYLSGDSGKTLFRVIEP